MNWFRWAKDNVQEALDLLALINSALTRVAKALEEIADALEWKNNNP